jgi:hypothetical protein
MSSIELNDRKPKKQVKNIEMLSFNGIWKKNNIKEYERLEDKFKGYLNKNIDDNDIKQAVNDVLFLYIKCKCYDDDDYSTCWNKCLENYIIAKQIKSKLDIWINFNDNNNTIKFESNKYLSNDELIIRRRYIIKNQENIINNLYAYILNDENYIIKNKQTFILNLSDELNVLNNNIILHYFNEFIQKYFTDNTNNSYSLPYRYKLIPDYAKISNDDDDNDDDDNDNIYNDNNYNYIYNDVENWVIFIDLTSIVLNNIKKNSYGTAIYDIIERGKFIGGVFDSSEFDSSEGGKKSRKIRKPYKSRKNHKSHRSHRSHRTHKTRKSRKFRKYKTTRFRKSNKHGRLYNN